MEINQIEANLENRQVYGYKHDGNTVTAHRWKVFHLSGNLYLQEPQTDKYGQRYAHIALFFQNVKIGLDVGILSGWQLDQYSAEDVERRISFAMVEAFRDTINAQMANGEHIKDSYIAFVRQYDDVQAGKMQSYKKEWRERNERERQAAISERERREARERKERERAIAEAVEKAEQAIISGGYISNKEIYGKPLFLHLFDKNGITVPIRSRGWIIDTLASVTQNNNGSASVSVRKSCKRVSNGFVSAYFELRNYLINAREEAEDASTEDYCTEEELAHLFGKAI